MIALNFLPKILGKNLHREAGDLSTKASKNNGESIEKTLLHFSLVQELFVNLGCTKLTILLHIHLQS